MEHRARCHSEEVMVMTNSNQPQDGLSGDAFFQTVFQANPDAAILTRVCDGEIIHVNESFCRYTGYAPNEVIGKTTIELQLYANISDRDAFINYMSERSILDPKPFEFRRKDGTLRSGFEATARLAVDDDVPAGEAIADNNVRTNA